MTTQDPSPGLATVATGGSGSGLPAPPAPAVRQKPRRVRQARPPGEGRWVAGIFLFPAAVLLIALVFYPFVYSVVRSLFSDGPAGAFGHFTWLNYRQIFEGGALTAFKNSVLWVAIVPAVLTIVGLIFAVLIERIRWSTAFKIVVFLPMSISMVAIGVTWGLIYADQPSRGLANAITVGIHDTFSSSTAYPGLHPGPAANMTTTKEGAFLTSQSFRSGETALVPLVGLNLTRPPSGLKPAAVGSATTGIHGVVWNDFKLGGGGTPGKIDPGELGLSGISVQAVSGGKVVASTTTGSTGAFDFAKLSSGSYQIQLPKSNFTAAFAGFSWLGSNLITPSIMIAFLWAQAGFAMVLISAGMSALPRDTLEAARIDGATEGQVFRRITAPLLAPTLTVVFITLLINVMKIFDIVYIISQSAGATGRDANVLATQLYDSYSNSQYGLASAVGVFLVILVIPIMLINIRRFRREQG